MSIFTFNQSLLRPGLIVSVCSRRAAGYLIRKMLKKAFDDLGPEALKVTPEVFNHDAIVIKDHGKWYIGDAQPWRARLVPIEEYEKDVNSDYIYCLRVFSAKGATLEQEEAAAAWWLSNVNGSWYDFMAYPRLIFKCIFGDIFDAAAGWKWANWCTEGVAEAYSKGAKLDVYHKNNPTPLTTVKRAISGDLVNITEFITSWRTAPIDPLTRPLTRPLTGPLPTPSWG